jgi:hypothetical protein
MITTRAVALLASAVGRGDWGRAMLGELEELPGRRARRRFALGCLRALVLSLPALALVALASGVLSLGLVAAALIRYPGVVTGVGTCVAVGCFVCVVATYVVVAAAIATRLVGSRLLAAAAGTAAAIAGSWFAVGLSASVAAPGGLSVALLVLGPGVALGAAAWATSRSGSRTTGVQFVGLASLLAGFLLFLLWVGQTVAFAGRPYDAGMRVDFRSSGASDLATYAVNDSLGSGMMLLLLVPLVSLTAGLAGAVVVSRRSRAGAPVT